MLAASSKLGGGGGVIHIKGGFILRLTLFPVFLGNTFRKQGMFMAQI